MNIEDLKTHKAHPLDTNEDIIRFYDALQYADQKLGRPLLPGMSLSAVSAGMLSVMYTRTKKQTHRKGGERFFNSALKAIGIDSVLLRGMADGVGRCEALDALEEYAKAINEATDAQRPVLTEEAWHTALGYALDCAAEEGWESITHDPRHRSK